jgi:hypothetical protein
MLRARLIKPSICWNADLAALGVEATLLFERLWMLADREGRLKDNPAAIAAEAFPLYPAICGKAVENLLKSLWKKGFIQRYKVHACHANGGWMALIEIVNFRKHQSIHPHERPSDLPMPPEKSTKQRLKKRSKSLNVITSHDGSVASNGVAVTKSLTSILINPSIEEDLSRPENVTVTGDSAQTKTSPLTPAEPEPKKPAATAASATGGERAPRRSKPVDFYPYPAADVEAVRQSLKSLARVALFRLPDADDGIIRAVLDACRGATADEIHEAIHNLLVRERFREVRSWGLLPHMLKPLFSARASGQRNGGNVLQLSATFTQFIW